MKVLISAAEASSDVHGAQLLKALRETVPDGETVDAFGIGGPMLQAEGLRTLVDARELLAMGLFAVLARLPKILSGLKAISEAAAVEKPDLAVVIDYPDFHFRFAKKLKRLAIPAVYFIPPKVWVWRQKRVRFLGTYFKRILCILPFEQEFYRRRGVEARFVGNPIVDELPFQLTPAQARLQLGLSAADRVVVLMPGSRPAELDAHFGIMLNAAARAAEKTASRLRLLVPLALTAELNEGEKRVAEWKSKATSLAVKNLDIRVSRGDAHICLVAADAGLIKSGTSTLEAALLGCPHSILYRASAIATWLFKYVVRYRGPVGLVNLAVLKQSPEEASRRQLPFREFLMEEARAELLGDDLVSLLTDVKRQSEIKEACSSIRQKLLGVGSPSRTAANEIWSLYSEVKRVKKLKGHEGVDPAIKPLRVKLLNHLVSAVWSTANAFMRSLGGMGIIKPVRLEARVISVGNIQAGGSGKTPLVAQIAREAVRSGKAVAILTRGYQGGWEHGGGILSPNLNSISAQECGDEAALLHDLVPEAWIGVGADRIRQFGALREKAGRNFDVVILDDGFQNWKIHKDVEVAAVTSSERSSRLFRDWPGALRGADLVVWTKGEGWPYPTIPFDTKVKFQLSGPIPTDRFILVTGVGDSESVLKGARSAGYLILRHLSFPDHARYAEPMVRSILADSAKLSAKVLTTGKDWVKWKRFLSAHEVSQVVVIEPEFVIQEGGASWSKRLWEN